MKSIVSITKLLILLCILLHNTLGESISENGDQNVVCTSTAIECYIDCQSCGPSIECPSGPNCEMCELNCTGANACASSSVYGYDCENVVINGISGDNVAKSMIVYAPTGDVKISTGYAKDVFKQAKIHSPLDSGSVELNCPGTDLNNECKEIWVNATYASSFKWTCTGDVKCSKSTIYCPNNNYMTQGSSCIIDCSEVDPASGNDQGCETNTIYAENGIPQDLKFYCNSASDDACTGSVIKCDNGANCTMKQDSDDIYYCDGSCDRPTLYPTINPTNNPTYFPTKTPTLSPTTNPTTNPTPNPTPIPTYSPTNIPTNLPSKIPSDEPTTGDTNTNTNTNSDNNGNSNTDSNVNSNTDTSSQSSGNGNNNNNNDIDEYAYLAVITAIFLILICCGLVVLCLFIQNKQSRMQIQQMGRRLSAISRHRGRSGSSRNRTPSQLLGMKASIQLQSTNHTNTNIPPNLHIMRSSSNSNIVAYESHINNPQQQPQPGTLPTGYRINERDGGGSGSLPPQMEGIVVRPKPNIPPPKQQFVGSTSPTETADFNAFGEAINNNNNNDNGFTDGEDFNDDEEVLIEGFGGVTPGNALVQNGAPFGQMLGDLNIANDLQEDDIVAQMEIDASGDDMPQDYVATLGGNDNNNNNDNTIEHQLSVREIQKKHVQMKSESDVELQSSGMRGPIFSMSEMEFEHEPEHEPEHELRGNTFGDEDENSYNIDVDIDAIDNIDDKDNDDNEDSNDEEIDEMETMQ